LPVIGTLGFLPQWEIYNPSCYYWAPLVEKTEPIAEVLGAGITYRAAASPELNGSWVKIENRNLWQPRNLLAFPTSCNY